MNLRTNYTDDVLDTSVNTSRKYEVVNNSDDTVSFVDRTTYVSEGDYFGAQDINATNDMVNTIYGYYVLDGWVGKRTIFNSDGTIKEIDTNSNYYVITTFNQDGSITQQLYNPNDELLVTRLIEFDSDGNITESVNFED